VANQTAKEIEMHSKLRQKAGDLLSKNLQPKERRNMNTSMQQKKPNNKGEEPGKINASFTNPKIEEETKQQGNVRYSGTNRRRKKTKPTQQKCHMAKNKSNTASQVAEN